jgi:hypothetical protein
MIDENAKRNLLKLFHCYNWVGDPVERKAKFAAYCEALGDLPSQAIIRVCIKAARGEVGVPEFLPTAAELYKAAVAEIPAKPQGPPIERIERVISPQEMAIASAGLSKLANELRQNCGQDRIGAWQSLRSASPAVLSASSELKEQFANNKAGE